MDLRLRRICCSGRVDPKTMKNTSFKKKAVPFCCLVLLGVQHNFKQRFALNEAGTHIRAKQGHSIKVDPSKLLRQLGTEDIGDMIPTCALHSTYLSNVQSIMQRGLMPGGTRGTSYRQHVHLAISDRPEAGVREVILGYITLDTAKT